MGQIISAREVRVGDSIRFCLRGYFLHRDPRWREYSERELRVKHISPTPEGRFEFYFDDDNGIFREIDPDTEVILVCRLAEYIYGYRINPTDPRDSYGGGYGVVSADSNDEAILKIHEKHGPPPVITIEWIYAIHHKVNLKGVE